MYSSEEAQLYIQNKLMRNIWSIKPISNTAGSTTNLFGREVMITDWYFGFWYDESKTKSQNDRYFKQCLNKHIAKMKMLYPRKHIALGEVIVDITEHFDRRDVFVNICIPHGGY